MDDRSDKVLAAVDLLAPAFETSGLDELELSYGELQVRLTRPGVAAPNASPPPAAGQPVPAPAAAPDDRLTPFGEPEQGRRFVGAPLTGIWYDAPSPGARPYVAEGAEVNSGQVIGLIEAMKLFNEIKADASGTITRVLVESGTLVKRKQPLMEIDPN